MYKHFYTLSDLFIADLLPLDIDNFSLSQSAVYSVQVRLYIYRVAQEL